MEGRLSQTGRSRLGATALVFDPTAKRGACIAQAPLLFGKMVVAAGFEPATLCL